MAEDTQKSRDRTFTAAWALILTVVSCTVLVLATPRALVPTELPTLVLDPLRVRSAILRDEGLAQKAPGGLDVDELEARYLAEGLAERGPPEEMSRAQGRAYHTRRLAQSVFKRVGPQGVQALRASALLHSLRAFHDEIKDAREREGLLGSLPIMLRTYGVVDDEGRLLAPELSLRAAFKARWNLILGLKANAGFSAIEVQALEGFVALHAGAAPPARRAHPARDFFAAGGHRAAEAYAIWLYHGGRVRDALTMMKRARVVRPELATRNFEIGIAAAAL